MDWKAFLKEFNEKLAEALKDKTAEERATLLAEASDALPQAARQHLHDLGHAEGKKEAGDTSAIEKERDDAKKAQEAAEAKAKKLEEQLAEKQPEVAKIRDEYEQRLSEKDQEVKAAQKKAADDLAAERQQAAKRQLETGLAGRVLTDSIARGIANDPQVASRLRVGDDGELRAYQADGKTPLALTGSQTAVEALVADVAASQPKELLKAEGSGGSGAGSGSTGDADDFAAIRDEVKTQYGGDADDKRKRLERL